MTEFTKEIIAHLKMFYNEDGQKSWKLFKMQKFWGEIWYMFTLLVTTFDRKILLMQRLFHWKVDFKKFPTVYYMSDSDSQARNVGHLKFDS